MKLEFDEKFYSNFFFVIIYLDENFFNKKHKIQKKIIKVFNFLSTFFHEII